MLHLDAALRHKLVAPGNKAPWLHGSTLDCTTGIQCIHGTAYQERSLETSAPA